MIEEVKKSGLRGREAPGLARAKNGSPTAWRRMKICCLQCGRGEPGTYKDRVIMENDPHSVLEGMAICAHAIGASKGYIYCRENILIWQKP